MSKKHPGPRKQYRPIYLKQWREHRGKKQEQLADAIGVSVSLISLIENGRRQYTQEFMEAAAEYLETDVASLLIRDPSKKEAVWTLWDRVSEAKKPDVIRVLEALADPLPVQPSRKKAG